jgi:hypothetical protein
VNITYTAERTPGRLHRSDAFYRCIRGPVRSGKSSACCIEIMMRAAAQLPDPADGIRKTRWAIGRNTYRELNDTTLKTWLMWFPEPVFGPFNYGTMTHHIKLNDMDIEVLFRAFDRPDDVKKLLSLELTGAWINEAREVPKAVIDMIGDRVEQYPPRRTDENGVESGCTWGGVILDTNSPDDDHWWFGLEAKPPTGWHFFTQPGALIEAKPGVFSPHPKAENVRNLNGGHDYYLKRTAGKTDSYIRVYYCNEFGFVEEGKRVHPEYVDSTHCASAPLVPSEGDEIVIGLDFGLTPAAAVFAHKPNGQWWLIKELVTENIGIKQFGESILLPFMLTELLDFDVTIFGDTHGNTGSQNDKKTPGQVLSALGMDVKMPAMGCGPTLRREALAAPLSRLIDGQPGLLVDPSAKQIRKGLSSKFVYKRIQVVGDEKYHDKPDKNFWSHICEAAEHAMVGAGEGKALTRKTRPKRKIKAVRRSVGGWMAA